MSRIDELIAEHCPDGVPFRPVSDVARYVRGVTYSKTDEQTDGPVRVLRSNNITLSSNTLNFDDVKTVSAAVRVRPDQRLVPGDILVSAASGSKAHVGKVAYIREELDYCFGGFMAVLRTNDSVESRFLFHLLVGKSFSTYLEGSLTSTTINNLNSKVMGSFRIPVPPPEVQREVVRILDQFTELEAELEAELSARRRQFEYYRDHLLTFRDSTHTHTHTHTQSRALLRWIAMGELGTFIRGRRFTKKDVVGEGIPSIHYGEIYTHYGVAGQAAISHVRAELAPQLRFAQSGNLVIAAVGETVEDVGKSVAWLGNDAVAVHDDCFIFSHDMDPKFVSYFTQTESFHAQKGKYVARAKVKRLSGENLAKITMPVMPLEEQERIVATLDKFDTLVNDLSIGLPAELAARRKQYEHYRDRLLTFKELAA